MKTIAKRIVPLALLALIASLAGLQSAAAQTAPKVDYDGDDDRLIEIATLAQLDAVRHDLDGDGAPSASGRARYAAAFPNADERMGCPAPRCRGYELANDLTSTRPNWVPIGVNGGQTQAYRAVFNGNGRSISGLRIESDAARVGMFGQLANATVRDLRLLSVSVTSNSAASNSAAGGLAGVAGGNIANVHVAGTVSGSARYVGGLAGTIAAAAVASSCADVAVSASGDSARAGGLAGILNASNSYVNLHSVCALGGATASGASAVAGGLAGSVTGANIRIRSSYARGDVSAGTNAVAGGLIGADTAHAYSRLEIAASYSAGRVSVESGRTGGLIGVVHSDKRAIVRDSLWDSTTSGIGDDSDDSAPEGRTTAQLQNPTAAGGIYANWSAGAWDFGTASQYPALKRAGGLTVAAQRQAAASANAAPPKIDYDVDNDDLIEIRSLAQLDAMRHDLRGHGAPSAGGRAAYESAFPNASERMGCRSARCKGYELQSDLVSNRPNWVPVGSQETPFSATFDGNGRSITGLRISGGTRRMGMFGRLSAATVRDLNLLDVDVISTATGADAASAAAGGLAGVVTGNISNVFVSGKVSGSARYMGGLAGVLHSSVVESSCADVAVSSASARARLGGLAGEVNAFNSSTGIYAVCALGDVTASGANVIAGGLLGLTKGADVRIQAAYARGDISAGARSVVGGLIGRNGASGIDMLEISESYSAGAPATASGGRKGGFIADIGMADNAAIADSHWNANSSGIADDEDAAAPEGMTNSQLRSPTSASGIYANWSAALWDFGNAAQQPVLTRNALSADAQRR